MKAAVQAISTPSTQTPTGASAALGEADIRRLAQLIGTLAPYDGRFEQRIPGLYAIRRSRPYTEPVHAVHQPALCIVAQGVKSLFLGDEIYEYDPMHLLIVAVDVPVAGQVTRASYSEPFLSVRLDLDPHKIAELGLKVYPGGLPHVQEQRAVYVGRSSANIVNAATRLLELMTQPEDAAMLAPLVIDEILIRLLRSPAGGRIAQIGYGESNTQRIAQAVAWLRANFAQPMNVEALAASVHMSVSSFHQHFKAVTAMSPLQYQKALRLQEARRLLVASRMDVTTASRQVGYISLSQFSREYGRYFGDAPARDIARLRGQAAPQAVSAP